MLEPIDSQYLQIGYIARSHGINGEVLIYLDLFIPQLFDEVDLVYIQDARGDLVPARVESFRVQEKNERLLFFVKFEHVTDRNQAEELKSRTVYAERSKINHLLEEEDTSTDYTSFNVYDEEEQSFGEVTGMIESPAHPILEVATKTEQQLLVPLVDEYIRSIDKASNIIRCKNLDQLTDEL